MFKNTYQYQFFLDVYIYIHIYVSNSRSTSWRLACYESRCGLNTIIHGPNGPMWAQWTHVGSMGSMGSMGPMTQWVQRGHQPSWDINILINARLQLWRLILGYMFVFLGIAKISFSLKANMRSRKRGTSEWYIYIYPRIIWEFGTPLHMIVCLFHVA